MEKNVMPVKIVILLTLAVLAIGGTTHSQAPKPVKTIAFDHPAGSTEPADVQGLFTASDLVLVGRVVAERPADVDPDNPRLAVIQTAYSVKVQEVFRLTRRHDVRGPELTNSKTIDMVIPHVGDRDRGSFIERYVHAALNPPRLGSTYLLFLRARVGDKAWMLATPSGRSIVEIRGEVVAPQDSSPEALRTARKSWTQLRKELLQLAGGRE